MKLRHLSARLILATALATATMTPEIARAQGGPPEQASASALQLFNAGNYKEAAAAYEEIIKNYPTSTVVSEAQFRLGYLYYLLGDFDKSLTYLRKILAPPASADLQELGYSLVPQALAAQASKEDNEAKRKKAFEEAIKQFDVFLKKYPDSDQVESATYGRALASYQIGKYDDAAASLKNNLLRFAKSESILDSQYLLAIVLATQGSLALQDNPSSPEGAAKCDEAEKLLRDIIAKRKDIALLNDAQFQIGEILFNRGSFAPQEKQDALWARAVEAYRAVQPKEPMIKAQEARLADVVKRKIAAGQARDVAGYKRLERLEEKERAKLETVKGKGDLTVSSQIKVAQIFFQQKRFDEARVLLRQMQQFAEDDDQKKAVLYYITLTYASQGLRDPAVQAYNAFQAAYKGDPMADNLPLVIGALFLSGDSPDPAKATEYFKEGSQIYPKGRFAADTLAQQANALVQLRRFDEALAVYRDFLKTKPKPELAAQAEFGIGTIHKETGKVPEAIAEFKKVRDTYAGTPQAEQAAFWVGQLTMQKGDNAGAVEELTAFLKKFPKSELFPTAKFSLAQAELARNDKAQALQLFKEVADEYPQSAAAPYTFFQRAAIFAGEQKVEEMVAAMKEFIAKYPESPIIFSAYDTVGQSQVNSGQPLEGIATYAEMVEKHPTNPQSAIALLNLIQLWNQYAESQGRYLALNEAQRAEWNKGITNSTAAAEKLLTEFPGSPQVAMGLEVLLADQKLLLTAKLKTDEEVTKYFESLAAKFEDKPEAKSKILFTLASFTYEKDKAKALDQMKTAYNPELVYAPGDIDLYGTALLDAGQVEESAEVYKKLGSDFPNPAGVTPDKANAQVQEAQAISLYGVGKALQKQGKTEEAGAMFNQLKQLYPWSPKLLEANYGIAEALHQQKKDDDAIGLLVQIIRAPTATAALRANSMLLLGDIQEAKGDIASAIDQYIKIAVFYESVAEAASEGLWKGGQLLEKQAATLPETPAKPKDPTKPGQLNKAIKSYKDLVEKYPNSPRVKEAQARLKALQPAAK